MEVLKKILQYGFDVKLVSFSAIDLYLSSKIKDKYVYIVTNANLVEISRLFDEIIYGFELFDFGIKENGKIYLIKSGDYPDFPFIIQYFSYDFKTKKFKNIFESFNHIKRNQTFLKEDFNHQLITLIENAKLIAKYNIEIVVNYPNIKFSPLNSNSQKELLTMILSGDYPDIGFELLLNNNFIEYYWPELYKMIDVEQIKDFHPEGNVWQHTMETFKYRKRKNFILSLALLFHDIGKAFTHEFDNKRFYRHAQIGANICENFLKKLEFDKNTIKEVKSLVKYHMLPEAIEKIPKHKLEIIKEEVDLNLLFELYRADISSSYKKLNNYYKFKKYIKNL